MKFFIALSRLAFAAVLFSAFLAHAEVNELRVGVRSTLESKSMKKPTEQELQEAKAHQSVYIIAKVEEMKMPDKVTKLVKPVNEVALVNELRKALKAHGYQEAVVGGPAPEIVLLAYYGRGLLPNAYMGDAAQTAASGGNGGGGEGVDTYVPSWSQLMNQRTPGYEEKLQRANYEKLVVIIAAVKYPSKKGERPQRLWKTIMSVDDPDHRDLNNVLAEMLAAGAGYFGRPNDGPEAEVWKPLPEGHVIIGETKVLEDSKTPAKK
ncbi:MAG: hypothetical protein JSS11_12485 [Verrucomicrobia bacterium]|nr:hypothetical protein [Verrucomicrobiota bacterium]